MSQTFDLHSFSLLNHHFSII